MLLLIIIFHFDLLLIGKDYIVRIKYQASRLIQ